MQEARWKGYIKDYNGSTMMQCYINENIDYGNISNTIKTQKEIIIEKINAVMLINHPMEGLPFDAFKTEF
jgi:histone acetyltransferase